MSVCLTTNEIIELTNKVQPAAQLRALLHLGIDATRRADGSVLVLRSQLAHWSGVRSEIRAANDDAAPELAWDSFDAA